MLMRGTTVNSTLDDTDVGWGDRSRRPGIFAELRDPRTFWLILRWRAWLVVAAAVVTVMIAGIVAIVVPPKYKATTIVLVDPRQPRVTNTEGHLEL